MAGITTRQAQIKRRADVRKAETKRDNAMAALDRARSNLRQAREELKRIRAER